MFNTQTDDQFPLSYKFDVQIYTLYFLENKVNLLEKTAFDTCCCVSRTVGSMQAGGRPMMLSE